MDRAEIVAPGASGEAAFSGFVEKWRSPVETDKMITRGRLLIHLQKASQLSKEWGGDHSAEYSVAAATSAGKESATAWFSVR